MCYVHYHSLDSAAERTGTVGFGGWAARKIVIQWNTRRLRLARPRRVAQKKREYLPLTELKRVPQRGFPPLSRIFVTHPDPPVIFTIR